MADAREDLVRHARPQPVDAHVDGLGLRGVGVRGQVGNARHQPLLCLVVAFYHPADEDLDVVEHRERARWRQLAVARARAPVLQALWTAARGVI